MNYILAFSLVVASAEEVVPVTEVEGIVMIVVEVDCALFNGK